MTSLSSSSSSSLIRKHAFAQERMQRIAMSMNGSTISSPESAKSEDVAVDDNTITSRKEAADTKKSRRKSRVLSGVQPTGSLHLGNYLGAIRQWVSFQDENTDDTENLFCVVDLHAITMPHDPKELEESTLMSAALYLAAGIDPAKSKVFIQSHVPAHTELAWLLNCATPINWLERMIQYKDKAAKASTSENAESVGVGLFTYPILMASDILLYQADRVPVGEDQRQHLELARDIVRRFNSMYCKGNAFKKRAKAAGLASRPVFTEPEAMIVKSGGARVMSLVDGTSKMSKSDPNDNSRINVLDPPNVIRAKIKKCKTDVEKGIVWDDPNRPEATNLLNIYYAVTSADTGKTKEEIIDEVKDMSWGEFKPVLADAIINHLQPIQERYEELRNNEDFLRQVLKEGADSAEKIAEQTLKATRVAMGFTLRN